MAGLVGEPVSPCSSHSTGQTLVSLHGASCPALALLLLSANTTLAVIHTCVLHLYPPGSRRMWPSLG